MNGFEMSADEGDRPRRTGVKVGVALLGLLAIGAIVLALGLRRQTVSYLTHWKGGPESSAPWAPAEGAPVLRLAVIGDAGDSGSDLEATSTAMVEVHRRDPFDALLLLGDNVYPDGDPARLEEKVFTPFRPLLEGGADLYAILGNHDVIGYDGSGQMDALGMEGSYWSVDLGEVLIVGLNSNDLDARQSDWLDVTLGASDAPWKIVALHHPPYSAGYQGSRLDIRKTLAPILAEHDVQLVLSGHDHDYQRSRVIDGVTYVVSGAGSGTRRTGAADFTAQSFSWLHFLDLSVYGDRIVVRPVNDELRVADEAVIRR